MNFPLLINEEQFYAYYLRVDGWMDGWILPIRKHNISLSLTLMELGFKCSPTPHDMHMFSVR